MSKSNSKTIVAGIGAVVIVVLVGCFLCSLYLPIKTEDLCGDYIRKVGGMSDSIILSNNGTFRQTITWTNGKEWACEGAWSRKNQIVELEGTYTSFDLERQTVIIPPELIFMQSLIIERGRLARNEQEPKWFKR